MTSYITYIESEVSKHSFIRVWPTIHSLDPALSISL